MEYQLAELDNDANYKSGGNDIGLGDYIYLAFKKGISGWPALAVPVDPAVLSVEEKVTLIGDITFETNYHFVKVPVFRSSMSSEPVGDEGSTTNKYTYTAFVAGVGKPALFMQRCLTGERVIALIPDADCADAEPFMLGRKCRAAMAIANLSTGTEGAGGAKGFNLTITSEQATLMKYAGTITDA